jgi:hypothetical protein
MRCSPLFLKTAAQIWRFPPDYEGMFFDPLKQRIVVAMHPHIYAFEQVYKGHDSNPVYFLLPNNVEKTMHALAISKEDSYLAIQNKPYEVTLVDYTRYQVPFICKISTNKSNPIIGINYLDATAFDFITIETTSLHLYKFIHKADKTSLSTVKSIVTPISNFYIDPVKCVLVLSSQVTKGLMQPYFFKGDDVKDVKGLEFSIKFAPENTETYNEKRDINTRNIKNYPREPNNNLHVLKLYDIYGKAALLHYNPFLGSIKIYFIQLSKVQGSVNTIKVSSMCISIN